MPFTGSHAAAALPLVRLGGVPSALVIGSLVPDLPSWLPYGVVLPGVSRPVTHSLAGVVGVDLVLGLLVFGLWHLLLAAPVVAASPGSVRDRLDPGVPVGLRPYLRPVAALRVGLSLVAGAAVHVAWDALTYRAGGEAGFEWLARAPGWWPGQRWSMVISSVGGLLVLAVWFAAWLRRTPRRAPGTHSVAALGPRIAATAWGVVLLGSVAAGGVAAAQRLLALFALLPGPALDAAALDGVTTGTFAGALLACVLALAWHVARRSAGASTPVD